MNQRSIRGLPLAVTAFCAILFASTTWASLVDDNLLTSSSTTTPWQLCDTDITGVDVSELTENSCAYRETTASPGITYKMTCGVVTLKYASITLPNLDAEDNTLASQTTDINGNVSGAYSVTLAAPAGTSTAAVGIYGEHGSGFQDCTLFDTTPPPEPTKGSISGVAWFDSNANNTIENTERFISSTPVELQLNGNTIANSETDAQGQYYFGNLDVDQCYTLNFTPADATLMLASIAFGVASLDNDAGPLGTTGENCLSEATPDVQNVDAAFVAVPPAIPPADYAICGMTWVDANEDGTFNTGDTTISHIQVQLMNITTDAQSTIESDANGNFVFNELAEGDYKLVFSKPDGYEFTLNSQQAASMASIANADGVSATFSLPADGNTSSESACTLQYANAGLVKLPVALDPTLAEDDSASNIVGIDFDLDILINDEPCGDMVEEVIVLGHNVPGKVVFDANANRLRVTDTTAAGRFTVEYLVRGICGSYATAVVTIDLSEPEPPIVASAPDAPVCRVETGGRANNGGVDVFVAEQFGFEPEYNLYDRNKELVVTLSSDDVTHRVLQTRQTVFSAPFFNLWEIEWNGRNYGYDQTSIHYMSAVANGVESALAACARDLISPIALDLNNDGHIKRIRGEFNIDITGDGYLESITEWFGPEESILIDAGATGEISGVHLFGNKPGVYADGFHKLSKLDSDKDGKLSGTELESLAIWVDTNSNHSVDDGEVTTLRSHNIMSMQVNHYKFLVRVTRTDGKTILMEDVWFPLAPVAQLHAK